METKIFDLSKNYKESIEEAALIIKQGGVVVFPTETVYGLGANAYEKDNVSKIFSAKGRPSDNPLIVHIADLEDIFWVASDISEDAKKIIDAFMPGPISVILKKNPKLASNVTAGLDTVAVRCPSSKEARDFIKACNCPVAAPSANISGKPSPTKAKHVISDMNGKVEGILIGKDCEVGLESTVIDMSSNTPAILRPGAITEEMIENVLGRAVLSSYKEELKSAPKAPGMKYTHYKPSAKIICLHGSIEKICQYVNAQIEMTEISKDKIACIVFDEAKKLNCENIFLLGSINSEKDVASNLFSALRLCDEKDIKLAFAMSLDSGGIGDAYINRLHKASDEIIYL